MSDADSGVDSADGGGDGSDTPSANVGVRILRLVTPGFIRKRFALKFALVLLVMGLAIGAIGAVATAEITDQTQDRIENEYSSLAVQEANLVDQWVERNRLTTRQTSGNDVWLSDNATLMRQTMQDRLENDMSSGASRIYVYEQSGDSLDIAATNIQTTPETMDQAGRGFLSELSFPNEDSVRVTHMYSPTGTGGDVIGFVSPIDDSENRFMLVEVKTDNLASQFQGSDRASGGFTLVVNESNVVMMDEKAANGSIDDDDVNTVYGNEQAQQPIRAAFELSDQPSGVVADMPANSDVIDEEYAVGYAPVIVGGSEENWAVLVHGPASDVFGFVQTVSDWGYIATAAAVLLIGLIGAVLGYNTASSIDRLTAKAEEMEDGNLDVDISSGRVDNIGRLYDGFASMRDALKRQIDEAEQARKEAEVSRAEAMEMNNYLQERAEEYSEIMQACARGDLTREMEPDGENEAMDQIAEDFNEMISELEMTTGQLKTFASEVEEAGRGVQESAETVRDASEQVADSIQKISDDAYDQKERLQSISEDMDEVARTLEDFADEHPELDFSDSLTTIQQVATQIDEAADLGEQTMDESENVAGAAEEQAAELNEVSAQAAELVRYARYLGDGLNNFETEDEHEFVFQTGAGGSTATASEDDAGDGAGADE